MNGNLILDHANPQYRAYERILGRQLVRYLGDGRLYWMEHWTHVLALQKAGYLYHTFYPNCYGHTEYYLLPEYR